MCVHPYVAPIDTGLTYVCRIVINDVGKNSQLNLYIMMKGNLLLLTLVETY